MFTKLFWKDALERALKTVAQALLALLVVAPNTSVIDFDWPVMLGTAATAGVVSVLTSVVSGAVDSSGTKTISPASIAKDDRGI